MAAIVECEGESVWLLILVVLLGWIALGIGELIRVNPHFQDAAYREQQNMLFSQ